MTTSIDHPPRSLAQALGRIPSGLFVVTARRGTTETGMLASWVQQCSFDPPQVSLAIRAGRDLLDWLTDGADFTINVLAEGQKRLLAHFGKRFAPGESAFDDVPVERPRDGAPVLTEALAHLDCRVAGRCPAGDHELIVGRVVGGRLHRDGLPLVHVRKNGLHY